MTTVELWTLILGAIAAVGAVVAAVVSIIDRRERKKHAFTFFTAEHLGWAVAHDNGRLEVIEIIQVGSETARVTVAQVVGARIVFDDDSRMKRVMRSGDSVRLHLAVEPKSIEDVYFRFAWLDHANTTYQFWMPAASVGTRRDEWQVQAEARAARHPLLRWRSRHQKVGPGGTTMRTLVRRSPRPPGQSLFLPPQDDVVYSLFPGTPTGKNEVKG